MSTQKYIDPEVDMIDGVHQDIQHGGDHQVRLVRQHRHPHRLKQEVTAVRNLRQQEAQYDDDDHVRGPPHGPVVLSLPLSVITGPDPGHLGFGGVEALYKENRCDRQHGTRYQLSEH